MINLIFELDGNYGDDLVYDHFPEASERDDWNSNSYAHGLLLALKASDPGIDFNVTLGGISFPGWQTPVPLSEFGIDEEE